MNLLPHEEYVEQAYFFRTLRERLQEDGSTQDHLQLISQELLATTQLPMAIQFLVTELKFSGGFAPAMKRLPHYFTSFQTYLIEEAENDAGQFDFLVALEILERDAEYRGGTPTVQGAFFYQFEAISRNRLKYDHGLTAMSGDPIYDEAWSEWLIILRGQIGLVDFADMVFVRSENYEKKPGEENIQVLFGEREGKIAGANHRKDPIHLFNALQRHLHYPEVPRHKRADDAESLLPLLMSKVEQLEAKVSLLEEELQGGINLSKFYVREKGGASEA